MYLMHLTQKELFDEIDRISQSINSATDSYYSDMLKLIRENEQYSEKAKSVFADSVFIIPRSFPNPDNLYRNVISELRNVKRSSKESKHIPFYSEPSVDIIKRQIPENWVMKEGPAFYSQQKIPQEMKGKISLMKDRYQSDLQKLKETENEIEKKEQYMIKVLKDSDKVEIKTININLNRPSSDKRIAILPLKNKKISQPLHQPNVFTFRVPDFTFPSAPKFIHYYYNLHDIETALIKTRNKNIFITLGLFIVSIAAISLISRRFLKPVANLRSSFGQVVEGNLNVAIPSPTKDEIGDLTFAFNEMVSELKKNKEKERILQQKEHLASMGQLAAGVAHEIKNPLNAINLTIQHLRDKYASADDHAQKYIESIQSEIGRLDKIVENFLNFIRSENLQKEETDINALILEVLQLFDREIRSQKISVDTAFSQSFIWKVDTERFKTVFMNLILNAIQAMPGGGQLKINTDFEKRLILIQDSGVGIPEKDLIKIFDLFFTTKSKGTGLGLPTSYKIVKEHGGDISIHSEASKGTTVEIKLKDTQVF